MQRIRPYRYIYRIDRNGTINYVNLQWLSFACENNAANLNRDTVLGQSLAHYIAGKETQYLYDVLIHKVRTVRKPLWIPFRCDSPSLRRYMELMLSPLPHGGIEFATRIVKQEPRLAVPALDAAQPRSKRFVVMCSWCKRVRVEDKWCSIETALHRLQLFESLPLPALSHGLCGDCKKTIYQQIQQSTSTAADSHGGADGGADSGANGGANPRPAAHG